VDDDSDDNDDDREANGAVGDRSATNPFLALQELRGIDWDEGGANICSPQRVSDEDELREAPGAATAGTGSGSTTSDEAAGEPPAIS
jgi:hypothetical protein